MNISSKNILKLSALVALVGLPTMVMATQSITVSINSFSSPLGGGAYGGEFTAVSTDPSLVNNGYVAGVTAINGGFETFCVQSTVDIYSGVPYSYSTGSSTSASTPQALTAGAAFLYYEFAKGNLTTYNYLNSSSGPSRAYDAGQLQAAIWYLMGGQLGYYGYTTAASLSNDSFYELALNQFGGYAGAIAANGGLYGVEILQLSSGNTPAQNQLALTGGGTNPSILPVPDGAMTVLLLGSSLLGAEVLRRKFVPAKA